MIKKFEDIFSVRAIAITVPIIDYIPDAEGLIAYQARVSNPANQLNFETADKLLDYCAREGHWSVFEMANLVMEIKAPRDISRQILRHSSMKPQEFSQRYAEVTEDMFCLRECRFQDSKNRQNSVEVDPENIGDLILEYTWYDQQTLLIEHAMQVYTSAIENGIAKEQARCVLPEGNTMSCMYLNGTIRSWIHYLESRQHISTQKEHRLVANKAAEIFKEHFPSLASQVK